MKIPFDTPNRTEFFDTYVIFCDTILCNLRLTANMPNYRKATLHCKFSLPTLILLQARLEMGSKGDVATLLVDVKSCKRSRKMCRYTASPLLPVRQTKFGEQAI